MGRTWLVGSREDCDILVDRPEVSGHHCRLTESGNGYTLEDLNSTNGTFVNGSRITVAARVVPGDAITLGRSIPLPWPGDLSRAARVTRSEPIPTSRGAEVPRRTDPAGGRLVFRGQALTLGRDPECDVVVTAAQVSWRHARLFREGPAIRIEDLGSSNGTFVNGRRVTQPTVVEAGDTIALGSHGMTLSIEGSEPAAPEVPVGRGSTMVVAPQPPRPETVASEAPGSRAGRVARTTWFVALPAQAVVLGLGIAATSGSLRSSAPEEGALAITSIDFRLALAAVWFGLSAALVHRWILASLDDPASPPDFPEELRRLGLVSAAGVCQCLLAWSLVASVVGLRAPWGPSIALMGLGSLAGLALGALVNAVLRDLRASAVAMVVLTGVMFLFGGPGAPLRPADGSGPLADVWPSRWTFEGLLLLEGAEVPPGDERSSDLDLAEPSFPAATSRSGLRACVLALGFLAIGMGGSAAFIERGPGARSGIPWPSPGGTGR